MAPGNLLDWIAFHLLPGLGPLRKRRVLEAFGDPGLIAHRLPIPALRGAGRLGPAAERAITQARADLRRWAERELGECRRHGITPLSPGDPAYPPELAQLPDAPLLLYLRGSWKPGAVRVAVVGSRRPTAYGRRVAAGLAAALAVRGVEIVSGGARGIDSCAHRAALEAGGRTIAVLGSGVLHPYPPENKTLFGETAHSGAVVSEFPLAAPPRPGNFPQRNRLISGLSAAVVVVEATTRSGSLSTANHALEQGREVLAVPGPVSSELSQGCHRLIQDGAKLVQNSEDILDELSPMYREALRAAPPPGRPEGGMPERHITADEAAVLAFLSEDEPVHVDELADRAPFGVARLQAALFGLVLGGSVEELTGRYYLCRPREEP